MSVNENLIKSETFAGTDPSSPTRKRLEGDFGSIKVSYNYEQTAEDSPKEIFIAIDDSLFTDRHAMLSLDPEQALELLTHLNDLLGKPMGYAAYAAG